MSQRVEGIASSGRGADGTKTSTVLLFRASILLPIIGFVASVYEVYRNNAKQMNEVNEGNDRQIAADKNTAERQLGLAHIKVGDVAHARGDLADAENSYRAGLAVIERLVAADPANAQAQHDLSLVHYRAGKVAYARGDLASAEEFYRAGLAVIERVVAAYADAQAQHILNMLNEGLDELVEAQKRMVPDRQVRDLKFWQRWLR